MVKTLQNLLKNVKAIADCLWDIDTTVCFKTRVSKVQDFVNFELSFSCILIYDGAEAQRKVQLGMSVVKPYKTQ